MTASGPDDPIGKSPRIDAIDGLRALALTAVFAFHTWEFAGRPEIPVVSSIVSQWAKRTPAGAGSAEGSPGKATI